MNLEPKARQFVEMLAAANLPPLNAGTPVEARIAAAALKPEFPARPMRCVEDHVIDAGSGVAARLYVPGEDVPAVVLYLHGGGWVFGAPKDFELFCRELATVTRCAVLSVDYRLAPEAPFPAAVDDSYGALLWLHREMPGLLGRELPIILLGDSAGGNLATVVAYLATERGGPEVLMQVLAYPVTDAGLDTPSYETFKDGPLLTRDLMAWFWAHYIPAPDDRGHPYASPLRSRALAGGPPAFILTAENDPLRDEGEAYAAALQAAGVPTRLKRYDGQIHAFLTMVGMFDGGAVALGDIAEAISERLANHSTARGS